LGGTVTTQSPSLLVATPCPFDDDEDEEELPLEAPALGAVVDAVTPFGPAVTSLDICPARVCDDAPPGGASTVRQGFPSGPVVTVLPSGPVLVDTEPPGPELDEDELDAAYATPIVATAIAAAAHIAIDERGMG